MNKFELVSEKAVTPDKSKLIEKIITEKFKGQVLTRSEVKILLPKSVNQIVGDR